MKTVKLLLTVVMTFMAITVFAQTKTESFKVYGNCGMCKKRIEKAVNIDGVSKVAWNVETKQLTLSYDSTKTSSDVIQQKIAAVGHDTEKFTATDSVYEKLPGCCLYDRKKVDKKEDHSGHKH
jgi:periplasmic mercuric ion binding protein